MEILAETNNVIQSYVAASFFLLAAILCAGMALGAYKAFKEDGDIVIMLFGASFALATVFSLSASYISFDAEGTTTYDVIIHDYNEVYENGYEIISRNGKIYTIREAD